MEQAFLVISAVSLFLVSIFLGKKSFFLFGENLQSIS
jgi:hypothetical protein